MDYSISESGDPDSGGRQPRLAGLNVQPILERRDDSIWAHVERIRDALYEVLQQACAQEGFDALVIKSDPFVQPAWVRLECWIPRNPEFGRMVTGRGSAVVTIEAKEFHRYNVEYTVEVNDRGWSKTYHRLREFGPEQARQLARFLLSGGPKPDLAMLRACLRIGLEGRASSGSAQRSRPFRSLHPTRRDPCAHYRSMFY